MKIWEKFKSDEKNQRLFIGNFFRRKQSESDKRFSVEWLRPWRREEREEKKPDYSSKARFGNLLSCHYAWVCVQISINFDLFFVFIFFYFLICVAVSRLLERIATQVGNPKQWRLVDWNILIALTIRLIKGSAITLIRRTIYLQRYCMDRKLCSNFKRKIQILLLFRINLVRFIVRPK